MVVAEGQAFVLLGEQGPRCRGEPVFERSWTDKVPAALDVLPQVIPAPPGDAATAGKELQAGLEGQAQGSNIPGEREW